uniref:Uncharacterized protein n=1 Tax=Tetraselmis sp. GSL018 TaxID=582737 RepID=A0A061S7H2_9CHLO|mmetsp:Transcript_21213/g.50632  ORF Transcript_21213/g.50632 Transcript_21213/m.50632 type:complete len:241 (+) Transcript_21213:508-1230(+)
MDAENAGSRVVEVLLAALELGLDSLLRTLAGSHCVHRVHPGDRRVPRDDLPEVVHRSGDAEDGSPLVVADTWLRCRRRPHQALPGFGYGRSRLSDLVKARPVACVAELLLAVGLQHGPRDVSVGSLDDAAGERLPLGVPPRKVAAVFPIGCGRLRGGPVRLERRGKFLLPGPGVWLRAVRRPHLELCGLGVGALNHRLHFLVGFEHAVALHAEAHVLLWEAQVGPPRTLEVSVSHKMEAD